MILTRNAGFILVTKLITKLVIKPITTIALSIIVYTLSLTVVAQEVKVVNELKEEIEEKEEKEEKPAIIASSKQAPVVIETQVKGSQEQPTVIYIMPWQGINTPVIVEGERSKIAMPRFKPIHPKQFKKQTTQLYN